MSRSLLVGFQHLWDQATRANPGRRSVPPWLFLDTAISMLRRLAALPPAVGDRRVQHVMLVNLADALFRQEELLRSPGGSSLSSAQLQRATALADALAAVLHADDGCIAMLRGPVLDTKWPGWQEARRACLVAMPPRSRQAAAAALQELDDAVNGGTSQPAAAWQPTRSVGRPEGEAIA